MVRESGAGCDHCLVDIRARGEHLDAHRISTFVPGAQRLDGRLHDSPCRVEAIRSVSVVLNGHRSGDVEHHAERSSASRRGRGGPEPRDCRHHQGRDEQSQRERYRRFRHGYPKPLARWQSSGRIGKEARERHPELVHPRSNHVEGDGAEHARAEEQRQAGHGAARDRRPWRKGARGNSLRNQFANDKGSGAASDG